LLFLGACWAGIANLATPIAFGAFGALGALVALCLFGESVCCTFLLSLHNGKKQSAQQFDAEFSLPTTCFTPSPQMPTVTHRRKTKPFSNSLLECPSFVFHAEFFQPIFHCAHRDAFSQTCCLSLV
jgi:hypothetical protein